MPEQPNHTSISSLIASRAASTASSTLVAAVTDRIFNRKSEQTTIHLEQYSPDASSLVKMSQTMADEMKHAKVEPIHLLACIVDQPEMVTVFQALKVNAEELSNATHAAVNGLPKSNSKDLAYLSPTMLELLGRAEKEANRHVGLDNLLNAISHEIRGPAGMVLQQFKIGPGDFRPYGAVLKQTTFKSTNLFSGGFTRDLINLARNGEFGPVIGRDSELRRLLQVLSRSTKNSALLVGEAGTGKTTIVQGIAQRMARGEVPEAIASMALIEIEINALMAGTKSRAEIEERIKQTLSNFRRDNQKVILVLEGVENLIGQSPLTNIMDTFKTMLLREEVQIFGTTTPEGLRKINEKDATLVRRFTLITIDPPSVDLSIEMLRGIANRFEEHHNVKISDPAIQSAVKLAKRYVQERALPDSAVDLLDEAAARKRVEMTGMPADLDRDIQRLASLKAQQSQLLNDTDPSGVKTLERINKEILELEPKVSSLRSKLERRRKVISTRGVVQEEYAKAQKELEEARASDNFARLGELEHKIIPDLQAKMQKVEEFYSSSSAAEDTSNVVGEQDVAEVVGEISGIPVTKMLEDEAEKLLKMEGRIEKRVVGQNEAVKALSKAVRRSRVGLRDPKKPIGSFLFLGPSGVGKTELAKALAEFLFDDEQAMFRFDCSEFMEKHNAQRLIGSPPGYVDSDRGGELTEAVKKRPYSVLLFDEVEKAHADVWNLLLQVLDDGRLSDSRGYVADFSNTVVIMTSNIGSKRILDANPEVFETEEGRDAMKEVLRDELKNFLRPEFINRIDDIVVFRSLSKLNLRDIVEIELKRVEKLVSDRELKLDLTDKAKDTLVEMSYEPVYGARPLKRTILKRLQDPMAEAILSQGFTHGSVIHVDVNDNDQFVFA